MKGGGRFWLVLVAALILVVVLIGGSGEQGPPLDPRSVSPDGARGLVEVLEAVGADVRIDAPVPEPDATTAILLDDRLTDADTDRIDSWVRDGGVLVVADLGSSFAATRVRFTTESMFEGICTIQALQGAEQLTFRGSAVDAVGRDSCFGDGEAAFVVAEPLGVGTVVTVGGAGIFTNQELGGADAAVIAVSLLAPTADRARVAFIGPSQAEFGDSGLGELVAPRVYNFIYQLLGAFLLYALYRSRRLGRVVREPLPVHIEGSELILKSGLLSERAHDPGSAAQVLRTDFLTRLRRELSVPADADQGYISSLLIAQTGLTARDIEVTLWHPVATDDQLLQVSRSLHEVERHLGLVADAPEHRASPEPRASPEHPGSPSVSSPPTT